MAYSTEESAMAIFMRFADCIRIVWGSRLRGARVAAIICVLFLAAGHTSQYSAAHAATASVDLSRCDQPHPRDGGVGCHCSSQS